MSEESLNSKLNILLCESENRVLTRLESWIKAMGDEVRSCSDGIIALELFKEKKPDILLLSQELKSMGGLELIELIKKEHPNQAVILMLSSDTDAVIFKRSIDLQVDKYLNKPVEASLLFNAIEGLSQEKLWHEEFRSQKRVLQDYKDAIDLSFSVSKHDPSGKLFYVNDLFCTTTKLRHVDAMKGLINPLQNSNEDMSIVWDALHRDFIYRDRQTFIFDDMSEHIVDVTAVAMHNAKNEVYEYLVFSNDVTETVTSARKIREQELDKKIQKLEHAKEVHKIKDSFLTVFTHELKTPLNSIINFSEYVVKHLAKEEFKKRDRLLEQVSSINSSGWVMLDMITNLIDAMKLRDSNIDLNPSEILLSSAVDGVLEKYSSDLDEIKIIKSYKQECKLYNDEVRITQIINNLISNAIKYCRKNIAIIIKSNKEDFVLEILDDGDGFADTSRVFKLFEQSDEDSMTRTAQGTGVGLYVVEQLCNKMDLSIEILKSKNLGGARVVVRGKKELQT